MSNEKDPAILGSGAPLPPQPSVSTASGYPTVPPGFPPHTQAPPPPYSQFAPGPFPPMAFYPPAMMPPGMYHPAAQPGNLPPPPPYDPQSIPLQQGQPGPPPPGAYPIFAGQPGPYAPGPYAFAYHPNGMIPMFPMMQPLPPNMAVVMPDGFDPCARFDGVSRPNIPPPPPGVVPNMAQQALMYGQGNQVIVGQKKAGFF